MPKKVPLIAITVHRDNKPIVPPVGKSFDFTDAEIAEVEAMMPGGLRDPVNEAPVATIAPAAPSPAPAAKGAKGAKGSDSDL